MALSTAVDECRADCVCVCIREVKAACRLPWKAKCSPFANTGPWTDEVTRRSDECEGGCLRKSVTCIALPVTESTKKSKT